jgi:hypothetical protein
MGRWYLLVLLGSYALLPAQAAHGCPVASTSQQVLVDAGLSSIRDPIWVGIYDGEEKYCAAMLDLPLSAVPSRSQVPRPSELGDALAPVASVLGVRRCRVDVLFVDGERDEIDCQRATLGFGADGSWSLVEDDRPCDA